LTLSTLDLTALPAEQQPAEVLRAFDSLGQGQSVRITGSADARKLLRSLIAARWGTFDWAPLTGEPARWQADLRKRSAPWDGSLRTFLAEDHRRCDALYAEAEAAAQAGDSERTRNLSAAFSFGMHRHFTMEEEGFFTEFEARAGMQGGGPTEIMREEHAQMRGLLDRLDAAAAAADFKTLLSAGETLLILMEQHNVKEEQMLYVFADEVFAGVTDELVKRLMLF
jgi:uncharacterized protein (DUF2249 family)